MTLTTLARSGLVAVVATAAVLEHRVLGLALVVASVAALVQLCRPLAVC